MAIHSSILAWKISWTERPGRLQSMGSELDTTERLHFHFQITTSSLLIRQRKSLKTEDNSARPLTHNMHNLEITLAPGELSPVTK